MNILVIGNGFDLEHGLPTKYKDFLDFLQCINFFKEDLDVINNPIINEIHFERQLENKLKHKVDSNVQKYFCDKNLLNFSDFNKWTKEEIFKELIECANNNFWINFFLPKIENENQGWIDFESEIAEVIKTLDRSYHDKKYNYGNIINSIRKEYDIRGYTNEIVVEFLNNHLINLIRCLEIYLEEFINKIDVKFISPDIKENHCDKVLSFNYTDTHRRLYDIYPTNPKEYDYIHGKADITRDAVDNNMVLGIDEYLNNEVKDKELEFIAFKKYFQRIYKKTGNTYKKWIKQIEDKEKEKLEKEEKVARTIAKTDEEIMDEVLVNLNKDHKNKIYIFGHSLDITDKDIIKELIECENTITTIFYYNNEVYAQQIANMVKIIGQDELIKRVSGANPTIIFKQQQERIQLD